MAFMSHKLLRQVLEKPVIYKIISRTSEGQAQIMTHMSLLVIDLDTENKWRVLESVELSASLPQDMRVSETLSEWPEN
jgi:CDP-diacylglycerol pyrophosphatase